LRIVSASCTTSGITVPVKVCTPVEWTEYVMERSVSAVLTRALWCDYGYPTATVHVAPLSSGTLEAILIVPAFTTFTSLSDGIPAMPPGYLKALQYSLSVELAPKFEREVPPGIQALADSTLAGLARLNMATRGTVVDPTPAAAQ
jgi:hypothetical protein